MCIRDRNSAPHEGHDHPDKPSRQLQMCIRDSSDGTAHSEGDLHIWIITKRQTRTPVSYTHLDVYKRQGWNDDDSILFFNCESLNKEFGSAYSALNSGSIAQKHKKNPLQPAPLLELRGGIFTTPVNIPLSVSAPRRGRRQAVFLEIIPHFGCKNMQNWGIGVLEKGTRYAILSTLCLLYTSTSSRCFS